MNSLHVKKILQSKIKAEVLETVEFEEASAQTLNGIVGEIITAILNSKRWQRKFILKLRGSEAPSEWEILSRMKNFFNNVISTFTRQN